MRRISLPTLRAAFWTLRSLFEARRQLRAGNFRNVRIAPPPALPEAAERGVQAILRRLPMTCLERSLVLQRWLTSHQRPAAVIIGVARSSGKYHAHAWLDGEPSPEAFHELVRLPAP